MRQRLLALLRYLSTYPHAQDARIRFFHDLRGVRPIYGNNPIMLTSGARWGVFGSCLGPSLSIALGWGSVGVIDAGFLWCMRCPGGLARRCLARAWGGLLWPVVPSRRDVVR